MREKLEEVKEEEETPSSSPSHEFSFTISLHHNHHKTAVAATSPPPPSAVDLSPADEIFFHGHLLPLHLISHLSSSSPRSSTNSLDSFTLPIKELLQSHPSNQAQANTVNERAQARRPDPKSKLLSIFGFPSKWKNNIRKENNENDDVDKQKKKILHVLKRYMNMVRPMIVSLREMKKEKMRSRNKRPFSSMNLTMSDNNGIRVGRGTIRAECSAPASMRTSPTNSGLLVPEDNIVSISSSDSTMEELQSAIQAAIAHCKSSIAMEDNTKG